jgi:monofunctional biosynthetic peptidoglycan transglycosylase
MSIELDKMRWRLTNDTVMGGLSESRLEIQNTDLLFAGELSLANNGGFASALGKLASPATNFNGVQIRASGDGRRYQLRLRQNSNSRAVAWRAYFQADRNPKRITIPAACFTPVIRGEPVNGVPPICDTRFHYLGFMLTAGQAGPFHLAVHELEFCQPETIE